MKPNCPPPESARRPSFSDDPPAPSPAEAFASASRHLAEIKTYAGHYLTAKLDGMKSGFKSLALYAVLGLLAGVAGIAILATAGVLLVQGIAEGLTVLFNGRVWLADLVTGLVLLLGVLGATYFLVAKILGKSRAAAAAKYKAMNRDQKSQLGHNVHERANEARAAGKAV